MFEFHKLLDTSYRTIGVDMERWFAPFPEGLAWNVLSDYCISDPNKANDAFAFAIVLNLDKQANISEYISAVAPSDMKGSRSPSDGMISYLKSPVVFSVSYMVQRQAKLLRDYITDDNIKDALTDLRELVALIIAQHPEKIAHYRAVDKRLASFQVEMKRRARNSGLARQIFLCASFAAILFRHLDAKKIPSYIRWISDRDAMFDKHDKVAFDIAFSTFRAAELRHQ